jgi:aspartate carbamoyltransferase regulatory subunit
VEVKSINNGIVIDHIKAGNGLKVFNKLFPKTDEYPTVLLMNVASRALGKKDIIKIENCFDVDLDFIGLIDPNISVNIIKDQKVMTKKTASLPAMVKGLFKCENPRCITNNDSHCSSQFELMADDNEQPKYICRYCEEITNYREYLLIR